MSAMYFNLLRTFKGFACYGHFLNHSHKQTSSSLGYHHRGAEPNEPQAMGMADMGPKEGVPEMARRMMPVYRSMVSAYKVGCFLALGTKGPGEGGLG